MRNKKHKGVLLCVLFSVWKTSHLLRADEVKPSFSFTFLKQKIGNKILSEREIKWRYKSQMSRHVKTKREEKDTLKIKCTQKERVALDVGGHFPSPFLFDASSSRLWS